VSADSRFCSSSRWACVSIILSKFYLLDVFS